jgi:elongator complex protein 1
VSQQQQQQQDDDENDDDDWFDATYIEASHSIVCMNHKGTIVSVDAVTGTCDLVGEFENGIAAGAWSPDREILVILTAVHLPNSSSSSVLLSMNANFDVLAEISIQDIAENTFISMCWTDSGQLAINSVDRTDSKRKIRIYSTTTAAASDGLLMQSIGRTEDGSGTLAPHIAPTPMAWAGTGRCSHLLASIAQSSRNNKITVAFFEPNGLRHKEFSLRQEKEESMDNEISIPPQVIGLTWNLEADLLAVTILQPTNNGCSNCKVQLWHRSNYHWYMKKEFRWNTIISCVKFHDRDPYRLYVLLQNNHDDYNNNLRWIEYKLRWDSSSIDGESMVHVTDGRLWNCTHFEMAIVPPPMYAHTLTMSAPVSEVAFGIAGDPEYKRGVALLSNGDLVVSKVKNISNSFPTIVRAANWKESFEFEPATFRGLIVTQIRTNKFHLIAITSTWEQPEVDFLVEIAISWSEDEGPSAEAIIMGSHKLEGRCLAITEWQDSPGEALLQLEDGTLLEYVRESENNHLNSSECTIGTIVPSPGEALFEPCPWIAGMKHVSELDKISHSHHPRLIIGMSARGRLYCHDILLADSISSFLLSPGNQFLCYATAGTSCVLRFLSLIDLYNFDPLLGLDENHVLQGYEPRNVERGSRIVAVLSRKPVVVLQMPRGNLETIHPMALVLRHVMLATQQGKYKEAFEMMRRQKVDLNLMVDMDPWRFLEVGLDAFLEQITNIDHLNLFISCLQNANSCAGRYVVPHWIEQKNKNDHGPFDSSTKVNQICSRLRSIMVDAEHEGMTKAGRPVNEGHYILPILSTFAKENPPQLQNALALIKDNALRKHAPSKKQPLFSEYAQHAIQYLAFLAEYELLFDAALSSYDYDMARAVARNSQLDPKKYLPLLKHFKELPTYFGRYEVDIHLKKYDSALRNLSKSRALKETNLAEGRIIGNDFESCMKLIEDHNMYKLGLELFGDKEQRRSIMLKLGDHLLQTKEHKMALCVFTSMEPVDIAKCARAAREAKDWLAYFSLLSKNDTSTDIPFLAREFAEDLVAAAEGDVRQRDVLINASRVLLDYAEDVSACIDLLIKASAWSEGQRVARLHSRDDLSEKILDAAVNYSLSAVDDFADRGDSYTETSKRYAEVLLIRRAAIEAGEGDTNDHADIGSLFSAASNTSNLSMRSSTSAGSAASISSFISVKSSSTFSLVGGNDSLRHKSRFNKIGADHKVKTKKKKTKGRKLRPGSEEELQNLVQTLQRNCVDEKYALLIGDTITFLVHNGKLDVARSLYDAYSALCQCFVHCREERAEILRKADENSSFMAREGYHAKASHSVESMVNSIECAPLPSMLQDFFALLP